MPVNEYNFVTVWKIEAPLQAVWYVICNVEDLPNCWKAVVSISIWASKKFGCGKMMSILDALSL